MTTQANLETPSQIPMQVIEPPKGWFGTSLAEVWHFRELLFFFVWRDVKVRYKQTILGVSWAVIQPFMTMVVFTIFFGGLAQIPSDGIPYPVFSYTALVPWTFFSLGIGGVANSIVLNASMLKKIYFPRLITPIAQLTASLVDFTLAFAVLIVIIIYYQLTIPPSLMQLALEVAPLQPAPSGLIFSANVIFLPFFLLLAFITALGVGLWLAALNVQFRDVRFATGFIVRLWMFITPVIYPTSLIDSQWQWLYALNPMTGVIDGFRWALLGTGGAPDSTILPSAIVALVLLITGVMYFSRMEKSFADVV